MTPNNEFVVVLRRGLWSTVLHIGQEGSCRLEADRLNTEYQTDEYKVEPWKD